VLFGITAWTMKKLVTATTQRDVFSAQLNQSFEREQSTLQLANAANAAQTRAESDLASERAAHEQDSNALALARAQLAAERGAHASDSQRAHAAIASLTADIAARDKEISDLTTALSGPDEQKAQLTATLTDELIHEIAARIAAEKQLSATAPASAAAPAPGR
jgi:hypothetical protein